MVFKVNLNGKIRKVTLSDYEIYNLLNTFLYFYDGPNPILVAIANHMGVDKDDIWNIEISSKDEKGRDCLFVFYEE